MSHFDLIVIGAGATGLAAARTARRAGRSVAPVEKARPGGDCTHYGCVPSKTLLDVAHRVSAAREAQRAFDVRVVPWVTFTGPEVGRVGMTEHRMLAGRLAQTMAPYPTYALGLRLAAARLFGEFGGATWRPARPDDAVASRSDAVDPGPGGKDLNTTCSVSQ